MRKILLSLVAAVFLLLGSGCGLKDIDKRFFVIVIGIDKGESSLFKVTLKLAIPSPRTEPGEAKFQTISQEADSIAEAVRLMKSKVDKEFDFGQAKDIVIGKSFADTHEIGHSLDFFFRRRDIQEIANVSIGEPDAATVINAKPLSERLPGNSLILAFSDEGTESPYIIKAPLFDYYRRVFDLGKDPYLPIIRALEETFVINRVAILKTNYKRLELDPDETAALNQLARGYKRFIIKSPPNEPRLTFSSTRLKSTYKILTPKNGDPVIRFHIRVDVESEESEEKLFEKNWRDLERLAANQLKDQYDQLLTKLQKHGVDPIGFGIRYRATHHEGSKEYENWRKIYPNVRFDIRVDVHFRGTGIIK